MKFAAFAILVLCVFLNPLSAQTLKADLIVINAKIRTMDAAKPLAEAVAIKQNKIVAIGKSAEIKNLAGAETKIIDAQGKLLIPGFNDSHVHFFAVGNAFFRVELQNVSLPLEIAAKLKGNLRFVPKGQWILGGNWNQEKWKDKTLPTKELLDAVAPDNPVFLYHSNPQIVLVNSLALKLAKIDKNTKEIADGEIVRDASGEPTGILKGKAVELVKAIAPNLSRIDKSAVLEAASNYAASLGITTIQDVHSDDNFAVLQEMERRGVLKNRVYECVSLYDLKKIELAGLRRVSDKKLVRSGCLKGFSEGDREESAELYGLIANADKANAQVLMHAIGAEANDLVLSLFERVAKTNGSRNRRFRIEHAHNFRDHDLQRFAETQTIASMQPFLFFGADGNDAERFRAVADANVSLAFGSDASMKSFSPFDGIYAAIYRGKAGKPKFTVEEAVRAYTFGSAYAEFQENVKGTLAVGKLADFVILSDDIFVINPNAIVNTKVLTTVMDGKIVYQKK
ncbi:MAG: amidohydrolase [Pyrinomonadaceae bacterium]|nr:amidohydrolase [Pyrinomonadaceae bacterium]